MQQYRLLLDKYLEQKSMQKPEPNHQFVWDSQSWMQQPNKVDIKLFSILIIKMTYMTILEEPSIQFPSIQILFINTRLMMPPIILWPIPVD
jgi:hypothetical protein